MVATDVASRGAALDASGLSDARTVGVQRADSIRVLMVERLPLPSDTELRTAALQTGLLGPDMAGLTWILNSDLSWSDVSPFVVA